MDWPVGLTSCLMEGNCLMQHLCAHRSLKYSILACVLSFSVYIIGSTVQRWLTTAPGAPTTHWYQLRCVLAQPIYVMPGQEITGRLHMVAHKAQSYTLNLTLSGGFENLTIPIVSQVLCFLYSPINLLLK